MGGSGGLGRTRGFVIEQDAVADVHPVRLAVVDLQPQIGHSIGIPSPHQHPVRMGTK